MGLLRRGAEMVTKHLITSGGEQVKYRRANAFVEISAAPARHGTRTLGEDARIVGDSYDWIIRSSDLVLNGDQVEPQRGDQIEHIVGSKRLTYTVLPQDGDDVFRFDSALRTSLRVHTKLTGAVDV